MKKTLLLALFCCGATFANLVFGQKISTDKVPAPVLQNFQSKFPGSEKAKWESENPGEFEVTFRWNGQRFEASFKADGTWLETESEIKINELPAAVLAALDAQFPGFEREEAEKVESPGGIAYELDVEKGAEAWELQFSPDGKLLKKEKEADED